MVSPAAGEDGRMLKFLRSAFSFERLPRSAERGRSIGDTGASVIGTRTGLSKRNEVSLPRGRLGSIAGARTKRNGRGLGCAWCG